MYSRGGGGVYIEWEGLYSTLGGSRETTQRERIHVGRECTVGELR